MKFTITGLEDGKVDSNGNVVNAKGGTEMMKEGLLSRLDPELASHFNIICSRVRNINPDKKNILWLHDTWNDPEAQHLRDEESRKRFTKLVFVSNYQFQTYHLAHKIPYSEAIVIKNAIVPIPEHDKPDDGVINLIYHTTPHRGLELLVPVFEHLYNIHEGKIHLDVFSSFNIYGWPHRDEPYKELFEKCRAHPGITYHGAVPNDTVREALQKAHIFAYPNIWPETSCISLMEAMSAKCAIICPNFAALPETAGNFANMYQYNEDPNTHANQFANILNAVIRTYRDELHLAKLSFQKVWIDNSYSWDIRISEWNALLNSLK